MRSYTEPPAKTRSAHARRTLVDMRPFRMGGDLNLPPFHPPFEHITPCSKTCGVYSRGQLRMQSPEGFVRHAICATKIIGTKCAVNFAHRASSTPDCHSARAGLLLRFPTLLQQIACCARSGLYDERTTIVRHDSSGRKSSHASPQTQTQTPQTQTRTPQTQTPTTQPADSDPSI